MSTNMRFPAIAARNLEGLNVELPHGFDGDRNLVIVAFDRNHQRLVDSWVPWAEATAAADPGFRFFEVPAIHRKWVPVRRFIDGGMAAAIRVPAILRRTLTYYGDLARLTEPLGIVDRKTIAVLLLGPDGMVRWKGSGAFTTELSQTLETALGWAADK